LALFPTPNGINIRLFVAFDEDDFAYNAVAALVAKLDFYTILFCDDAAVIKGVIRNLLG
jgi:hypothetical protein